MICEEFGCTPSEALEQDFALVTDIMDLRRYRKSYWDVKRAKNDSDVDEWGKHWVFEVQASLLEERRKR